MAGGNRDPNFCSDGRTQEPFKTMQVTLDEESSYKELLRREKRNGWHAGFSDASARDPSGDHLAPFLNLDVVFCVPLLTHS